MSGTKEIKRRIKSVKNTKKITKAMELVAASKMKRAVANTLASRPYAKYSWEILTSIANSTEKITHPFFEEREVVRVLVVLITSNRGLCGSYNAQVIKKAISGLMNFDGKDEVKIDILTIGKKGDSAMRRVGQDIVASFIDLPENISSIDVVPISDFILSEYSREKYDKVLVAYTDFISALTQKANLKQILPISKDSLKEVIENLNISHTETPEKSKLKEKSIDYLFEGGTRDEIAGILARKLTRMQIYQMLLESNASEQSARMVAMKNASEASGEMIDELTLMFNKARQAGITKEISEISAGMASVA